MEKFNKDIREMITESGLHFYEVAAVIGVDNSVLSKWLRFPLRTDRKQKILDAIEKLNNENK